MRWMLRRPVPHLLRLRVAVTEGMRCISDSYDHSPIVLLWIELHP